MMFLGYLYLYKKNANINNLSSHTDTQLLDKIKNHKSQKASEELYRRYHQKIYNKCRSFCKSKEEDEAEDLTQEIFIKVFDKIHSFRAHSSFSTWLYSVTYNHLVNYQKNDEKRLVERWEYLNNISQNNVEDLENEEHLFLEMKSTKLEKALDLIEPEDKALLLMKYSDNIQISDMLKTFNIKESALKMRLKRAKSKVFKVYKTLN